MNTPPKAPLAVSITQILLALSAINLTFSMGFSLYLCRSWEDNRLCVTPSGLLPLVSLCLALALLLASFWGIHHRKAYGKWGAAFVLGAGIFHSLHESFYLRLIGAAIVRRRPLPPPPYDCWQGQFMDNFQTSCGYSSYSDLATHGLMELIAPALLGLLGMRLLLSRTARRFFTYGD